MRNISLAKLLLILSFSVLSQKPSTYPEIKVLFEAVKNDSFKGPYACNARQTDIGRYCFKNGGFPHAKGKFYFDAAFRDAQAFELAELDFYVANLFSTNYHYLYAKNIVGDSTSTGFEMNQEDFLAKEGLLPQILNVLHQTFIERFYNIKYPSTKMATTFYARGVSGSEYEQRYINYLAEYIAKNMQTRTEYLALFELLKRYDLSDQSSGVSIKTLRDDVDKIYQSIDPAASYRGKFRVIRNKVHNSLNQSVITDLKSFKRKYGILTSSINKFLVNLEKYFATNAKSLIESIKQHAQFLDQNDLQLLTLLKDKRNNSDVLLPLSEISIKLFKKIKADRELSLSMVRTMIKIQDFILKDIVNTGITYRSANKFIRRRMLIAINSAYTAGLLKRKQHKKLVRDINDLHYGVEGKNIPRLKQMVKLVSNVPTFAAENLKKMFGKSLQAWFSIDPIVDGVIDDTLKSSLLIDLSQLASSIRKKYMPVKTSEIMWEGTAYGYLTFISKEDMVRKGQKYANLNPKSIPVFEALPLDLTVVAGVITLKSQTDLDHVNLKSKQRNTPNLVYPSILSSDYSRLIEKGALVKMVLKGGEVSITPSTENEANLFWQNNKPEAIGSLPKVNLRVKKVLLSSQIGKDDVNLVGAKAANYGEIYQFLKGKYPYDIVRMGFAIPFAYYKEFIDSHADTLNIEAMLTDEKMAKPVYREKKLAELREKIYQLPVSQKLVDQLQKLFLKYYPEESMRFRSSTNSEDLANFSGAGLYDSTSYDPVSMKRTIADALRIVWASVWNRRAYDEREYYGIDHRTVYVAVQLNPGFPDEEGNGVAISRNTTGLTSEESGLATGIYFNNQKGEYSVTNPTPGVQAEEMVVYFNPAKPYSFATTYDDKRYIKLSSETRIIRETGKRSPVFKSSEMDLMVNVIRMLHNHFKQLYDPKNVDDKFALDLEFKVDDLGTETRRVYFKQARPYVAHE